RLEEVHLADRVRVEGLGRRLPRGRDEALAREMDDVVGHRALDEMLHGREVAQVALDEMELVAQVIDVLGLAAPAARAPHFRALRLRLFREVTADKTGDAGDENANRHPAHHITRSW